MAALSGRSARSRAGLILVEGPQAVRELLAHRAEFVRDVYFGESAAKRYPELVEAARRATRFVHLATDGVAAVMSGDAQGVIAVADVAAVRSALETDAPQLVVVLAEAQDPGNVGTIIRLADACGAQAIYVAKGGADVTSPKVIRASVGSVFHLPVISGLEYGAVLDSVRQHGLQVLAAHGYGQVSLEELMERAVIAHSGVGAAAPEVGSAGAGAGGNVGHQELPELGSPTAWVFGNEARGLSPAQLESCDAQVKIALRGHAESFNVAGAAAILLHASAMAQRPGQ
ncbi:MAG: RNA methyltransferase [Buchananella hordeovulneris]|nr:RNA methyltransferase [Buchananella hordeovulneris]